MVDPQRWTTTLPMGAVLGLTIDAVTGDESVGDWLVVDDEGVVRDIAARPADPVTYADRVRPVDPADPAVVLDSRSCPTRNWSTSSAPCEIGTR